VEINNIKKTFNKKVSILSKAPKGSKSFVDLAKLNSKQSLINAENKIHRAIDTDQSVFYATSNAIIGNRYVTIPDDLRAIRYVQLKDSAGNQFYLEQKDTSYIQQNILLKISSIIIVKLISLNHHYS